MNQVYKKYDNQRQPTHNQQPPVDEKVSDEIIKSHAWCIIRELNKRQFVKKELFDLKQACFKVVAKDKKE